MTATPDPSGVVRPGEKTETANADISHLPAEFDVTEWTRQACEASGVSFAVTDPVALDRLRALVAHPG